MQKKKPTPRSSAPHQYNKHKIIKTNTTYIQSLSGKRQSTTINKKSNLLLINVLSKFGLLSINMQLALMICYCSCFCMKFYSDGYDLE